MTGLRSIGFLAVAVLALCLSGVAEGKVRIRKEMRTLTPKEYKLYLQGLATMYSVDITNGQKIFGPKYRDYEYFIMKHAIITQTPIPLSNVSGTRYDLGHFGPWFMTFHQAFVLEFENSLLSVVPEIGAAPYWDIAMDFKGTPESPGTYYNSSSSFFSEKYLGHLPGDPENNFTADTPQYGGVMAGINVKKMNYNKWANLLPYFNGSKSGYMRDPANTDTTPYLVRYPYQNLASIPSRAYMAAGPEMNYTRADLALCMDPTHVADAFDFILCIDTYATVVLGVTDRPDIVAKYTNAVSAFSHILFHNIVGSFLNGTETIFPPFGYLGDARVVNTSPNELMGFFPFHSNIVRAWMIWMRKASAANSTLNNNNVMYGYPQKTSATANPYIVFPGSLLDDPISPAVPFTDILNYPTPNGATHRDLLTYPHTKYYKYDNMHN